MASKILVKAAVVLMVAAAVIAGTGAKISGQTIFYKYWPILPNPDDFVEIAAGGNHTCARKNNGEVYCWGLNYRGAVGASSSSRQCAGLDCVDYPQFVTIASQVDAGYGHTCAILNGVATCWGDGNQGQNGMGNGVYGYAYSPTAVVGNITFTSISAGGYSTCGTATDGIYCWGDVVNRLSVPQKITSYTGYRSAAVGRFHMCAIFPWGTDRYVDCFGNNRFGQKAWDPNALFFGDLSPSLFGNRVSRLSAEGDTTCVDQMNGTVQCVGYNYYGQLGNGTTSVGVIFQPQTVGGGMALRNVSVGGNHVCALNQAGQAYCWGNGGWGQIGHGQTAFRAMTPQLVTGGPAAFRAVAAGGTHTCGIGTDNGLYCWGSNTYGQLGTMWKNPDGSGGWVVNPVRTVDPRR